MANESLCAPPAAAKITKTELQQPNSLAREIDEAVDRSDHHRSACQGRTGNRGGGGGSACTVVQALVAAHTIEECVTAQTRPAPFLTLSEVS